MEAKSRVTLRVVAATASVLYRGRVLAFAIALGAGIWFAVSLGGATTDSASSLLALTVLLWAALALGTGYTLLRLPPAILPADRFGRRLRKRGLRIAYWLALLAMLGLAGFTLLLTLRALSLGFG